MRSLHRLPLAAVLLAGCAGCALVPAVADAAQPRAGVYSGATTQPDVNPYKGSVRLRVAAEADILRVAKITARVKLDCQGDPAQKTTLRFPVPAGKGNVSASGRFRYEVQSTPTSGFMIKGRFATATSARGTFGYSDAHSGCYVGDVHWRARLAD
jgi:hypothetical protein